MKSKRFISKPDNVTTTLVYPVTLTTEENTTNAGMTITGNASAPAAQQEFQVQNSSSTIRWTIPVAGGPKTHSTDLRSYNTAETAYVALNGQTNPPSLELAASASAQGPKIFGGFGPPDSHTFTGLSDGDFYMRQVNEYSFPIMVGNSSGWGTTTTERYLPTASTNNETVGTVVENSEGIAVVPMTFSNLKTTIATAAGGGITRTHYLQKSDTATALSHTIVDPATSGSNTSDSVYFATNEAFNMANTASSAPVATLVKWRLNAASANQVFSSGGTGASAADRFIGIQENNNATTTATAATQIAPANTTLRNLRVKLSGSIAGGTSYQIELYTGTLGAETASGVTVTVTSANFTGVSDTTHSVAVTQGQGMYFRVIPSGSPTGRNIQISIENATGDGTFWLLSSNNNNVSNAATVYNNWYGNGAWNATEANVTALGAATTVVGLYGVLSADTGAAKTRVLTFRKGGAGTAAAITFNNSGVAKSWTGSVSVADDDLICTEQVPTGTPTAATLKYGVVCQATIAVLPYVYKYKSSAWGALF